MSLTSRLLAGMAVVVIVLVITATVVTRQRVTTSWTRSTSSSSAPSAPADRGPADRRAPMRPDDGRRGVEQLNDYFVATVDGDGDVDVLATPGWSGDDAGPSVDLTPALGQAVRGHGKALRRGHRGRGAVPAARA